MKRPLLFIEGIYWDKLSSMSWIAHKLVRALRKEGWDILVFAPVSSGTPPQEKEILFTPFLPAGLTYKLMHNLMKSFHPLESRWFWEYQARKKIADLVQQYTLQGIYAMGPFAESLAFFCFRRFGIPYVVDRRDAWTVNPVLHCYPFLQRWKKHMKNQCLRKWDKEFLMQARFVFFLAEQVRKPYLEAFHLPQEKTEIASNFWDPEDIPPLAEPPRKREHINILFSGSLPIVCWKSLARFLQVLHSFPEMAQKTTCTFIFHSWGKETQKFLQSLSLPLHFHFPRPLSYENFLEAVHSADICLTVRPNHPYDYGSGREFTYMAFRKPVVAIAHPLSTAGELVRKTQLGWVAHPEDTATMKNILREILEKWEKGETLIQPDEEQIRKFSLPEQSKKISSILSRFFTP
ncbi:MAG: glycosyltransferase [bacterium JZ-2024 1]